MFSQLARIFKGSELLYFDTVAFIPMLAFSGNFCLIKSTTEYVTIFKQRHFRRKTDCEENSWNQCKVVCCDTHFDRKMGRVYLEHFGGSRLFSCAQCDTFLTNRGELISTRFTGSTGRAYLFNRVVNLSHRFKNKTKDVRLWIYV